MSNLLPVPTGPMYIDNVMTIEWQDFFRNLRARVVSPTTTETEETEETGSTTKEALIELYSTPTDYQREINRVLEQLALEIHDTPAYTKDPDVSQGLEDLLRRFILRSNYPDYGKELDEVRTGLIATPSLDERRGGLDPLDFSGPERSDLEADLLALKKAVISGAYDADSTPVTVETADTEAANGYASDSTERTTSSTTYAWEDNLDVEISASVGDIIVVELDGWFKSSSDEIALGYIDLYSGSATRLGDITYYRAASTFYDSKSIFALFEVTTAGTLHFRMKFKSDGGNPVYTSNRIMRARVIGTTNGYASDSTERTTTSTSYVWEDNLDVGVNVIEDDLVLVELDGWAKNNNDEESSGHIELYSGSATRLGDTTYYVTHSTNYDSKHISALYRATATGTLHFRMKFKSVGGKTVYVSNRSMMAWVI